MREGELSAVLTAVDDLPVKDGDLCLAADTRKGIGCPDHHVSVFADFQAADPIPHTQRSGGVDGDRLPGDTRAD